MADDEVDQDFKNLELVQSMIDISAERLDGLRTKCATSAQLTQQEIRTLEVNATIAFIFLRTIMHVVFPGKTYKTVFSATCC